METGRLLTVQEVAELTGWRESTVRAHILHRRIPFFKLGRSVRIAERDLEKLLAKSRIPARDRLDDIPKDLISQGEHQ